MCRILFARKSEEFTIEELLNKFADMCSKSKDPSGDWQGDGWGVSWLTSKGWETYKSASPVWDDRQEFHTIPQSRSFLVHARSKSFKEDIVDTRFNQPYVENELTFAFNGALLGVGIPIEGEIGAQKIFNLVKRFYRGDLEEAVNIAYQQLKLTTKEYRACNLVVSDGKKVVVLCSFTANDPEYYTLRFYTEVGNILVCSEKLIGFEWSDITNGRIKSFV